MATENLFRVTGAADLIGLSRQRIWLLINQGRIKTVEQAGVTMIALKEIERFKKVHRVGGRPKTNGNPKKKV